MPCQLFERVRKKQGAHLLAIDLDESMDDKLSGLAGAAGEESTPDGGVEPSLGRKICHVHVWRCLLVLSFSARVFDVVAGFVKARTASGSLIRAICAGEETVIHGDNGGKTTIEHAGPFAFTDLLAVVGTGQGLCQPFLLEEGLFDGEGREHARDVVQGPFRPVRADFLRMISGAVRWREK